MPQGSFINALLRKKAVVDDVDNIGLRRCLSAFDLTLMGIGAIIGTGIFVLTGVAAATTSGPAVIVSFVIAGFACAFAALAYAELASSVGGAGSAYGYSYAAFGEFVAWIIGWDLILEYGVSVAAVANGWSGYFNNALHGIGLGLPAALTKGPFAVDATTGLPAGGIINLPAFAIVFVLMIMLIIGVKQSAKLNTGMVFVKLLAIVIFLSVAIFHVNPENWSPFIPFGWFSHDEAGKPIGILAGASVVFFAYVGFDAVSTATEESNSPQRDVPIGILASLIFCTVIYILVAGILTGIVSYKELNVSSPVAFGLERIGINWASSLVATGVIAGLTTVMLVLYYALTRILTAMSRDGLVSPFFSAVNPKTQTPVKNTVICGTIIAVMAGFIPLNALAELVNIGTLTAFVLVCVGVISLRKTHPDLKRPFTMPGGIILPVLGVISCLALIGFLPWQTHLRFVLWLAVGLIIYFAYGIHKSRLRKADIV
ncbi:MAG: amino acid permease [Gammaproteobacteria bacterium]|nr:MAG: amino acid permease [Gammaproteobacteria bacterium]